MNLSQDIGATSTINKKTVAKISKFTLHKMGVFLNGKLHVLCSVIQCATLEWKMN